ncbi:MAG: Na/Pi cotransporter family protein [Calditrichaeota bacterium]|nr:MAG: Na/Pi cotransporter family protein [Calditrichota bacterium]
MNFEIILKMLFNLVGGLGIFLLGMKYMQQGLQVVAGPKIRQMINSVTSNRFLAVGIGLFVTTLVQSSSVTSVMVIGFVNSELMALSGAIGVIMGANIGTTITGWMLALKIGKYGLPIVGLSAFGWLFLKKERYRYIALALLGIGMVFFGLELMKNGFKPLRGQPEFTAMFHAFHAADYFGVLKAALVGCVLTVIVQSSSATLGITIALANTGVIDFYTAAALVLGENIGTTITAFLASLGAEDINAKRAAYFHVIFNVLGVLWITALFHPVYIPLITKIVIGIDPNTQTAAGSYPYMTAAIAAVHSGFNIANALLFLPFTTFFANLLNRIGKEKVKGRKDYLTHLNFHVGTPPLAAIEQSHFEISRMEFRVREMIDNLKIVIKKPNSSDDVVKEIFERENILDHVQKEITTFLTDILGEDIPNEIASEAQVQLRMADEYESISDEITAALKLYLRLREYKIKFTKEQANELLQIHDDVAEFNNFIHRKFAKSHDRFMDKAYDHSQKITERIRELRSKHWSRLSDTKLDPMISTTFMDIANVYRRSTEHLINVAEALCGFKRI